MCSQQTKLTASPNQVLSTATRKGFAPPCSPLPRPAAPDLPPLSSPLRLAPPCAASAPAAAPCAKSWPPRRRSLRLVPGGFSTRVFTAQEFMYGVRVGVGFSRPARVRENNGGCAGCTQRGARSVSRTPRATKSFRVLPRQTRDSSKHQSEPWTRIRVAASSGRSGKDPRESQQGIRSYHTSKHDGVVHRCLSRCFFISCSLSPPSRGTPRRCGKQKSRISTANEA